MIAFIYLEINPFSIIYLVDMSQSSINAAKKRRGVAQVGPPTPPPRFGGPSQQPPQMPPQMQSQPQMQRGQPPQNTPQPVPQTTGLTLPQVIALIDTRLVKLEKFMNESPSNNPMVQTAGSSTIPEGDYVTADELAESVSEFDGRFQMLATEIANLKDVVLSLQKYTMDVNRMLLETQSAPESDDVVIDSTTENSSDGANVQFMMSSGSE